MARSTGDAVTEILVGLSVLGMTFVWDFERGCGGGRCWSGSVDQLVATEG
jgi:hypothetical protein